MEGSFVLMNFHLNIKLNIMDTTAAGYWKRKKEKLRQKYPTIKEQDLRYHEGKENEMIEMLGYKLGKTKEELLFIIAGL
jgi:hypothetical protein